MHDPLLTPVLEYVFDVSVLHREDDDGGNVSQISGSQIYFRALWRRAAAGEGTFRHHVSNVAQKKFRQRFESKLPSAYFKNLYFDTSGSKSPASLACALELADAAHILFGSDFPANQNIPEAVACVRQASISGEDKRAKSCIMTCLRDYDPPQTG